MAAPPVPLSRVIDDADSLEALDVGQPLLVEDLPAEVSPVIDEIGEPRDARDPDGGDSDSAQSSPIAIGAAVSADDPSWEDPEFAPPDIEPHSLGESLDADVPWLDPGVTRSPADIGEPLEVSPLP